MRRRVFDRGQIRQGPSSPDLYRKPITLSSHQTLGAGEGNHGAVIGAELHRWIKSLCPKFAHLDRKPGAQITVGAHTARHDQLGELLLLQGASALNNQRIDHSLLEGPRHIGSIPLGQATSGFERLDCRQRVGFEPAERKIKSRSIDHRPWEVKSMRITAFRKFRDFGPTRIR